MSCFVCLESTDDQESLIDVLSKEGQALEVQKTVEQHFWFRFEEHQSNLKRYVCRLCWNPIFTFHQFYIRVEQAHNPLKEIALKLDSGVVVETQPFPLLDVGEDEIVIKTEPLCFHENFEDSLVKDDKEEIQNMEMEKEEEMPKPPEEERNVLEEKMDSDIENPELLVFRKRRGRPKKEEHRTHISNRRPKRKVATVAATAAMKRKEAKIEKATSNSNANFNANSNANSNVNTNANITENINAKENENENAKTKEDVEEKNESVSDSDHGFNDADYEPDVGDCDSEEDTEKPRKSVIQAPIKQKNSITRQSDAYIAQHFKLTCCLCNEELTDFNFLKMHFRAQHKVRGYVYCCQKKFLKRGLLVDHLRTHEDPEYFKCQTCEKVLADRRCLEIHLKLHEGNRERIFQCAICTKGFFKKAIFKRHMLLHTPDDEKKEICGTCNKAFPTKYILNQHIHLTHLNKYAHICDVCGKAIRGGRELFTRHMTLHTGQIPAPVTCKICGTTVTTKYGLSRHMRTMHNEDQRKPLQCQICSKVSPSVQAHKSHMKYMHNTERKHQCPMCKKAFKRPTELKEHLSTHTGEILYTCPHCPKTFKSNANMHSHRKKMHRAEWEERRQQRFKNSNTQKNESKTKTEMQEENLEETLAADMMAEQLGEKSDENFEIETKGRCDIANPNPSNQLEHRDNKTDFFDSKSGIFPNLDSSPTDFNNL